MSPRLVFLQCTVVCACCVSASAQKPGPSSDASGIPNVNAQYASTPTPHNWSAEPPTFSLTPAVDGARKGNIWLRKAERGLVVAGHVDGVAPIFPSTPATVMQKDHVEIWLAIVPTPQMPVIGWGNQFGDMELPKGEASCDSAIYVKDDPEQVQQCKKWVREQESYRVQLRRLFTRQWQLAPGVAVESFALPAYQAIAPPAHGKEKFSMKPQGLPQFAAKATAGGGYDFEALIPWSAFPPADQLNLKDLFVMVDVFNPAGSGKKTGPYSTTSPARKYGDPTTFNPVHLNEPRQYQLTSCKYPLIALDFFSAPKKSYFLPTDGTAISTTLLLDNYRGGYAYEPTGRSPEVFETRFYQKSLGPDEFLCGPLLRYSKSGNTQDPKFSEEGKEFRIVVDEASLGFRRAADGQLFIRNGPREDASLYGSGQCGACPRPALDILSIGSDGKATESFSVMEIVGNEIDDMDIQLSKDWSRIGVYRHKLDENTTGSDEFWSSEFFCLKGSTYQKCPGPAHQPPPKPRTLEAGEP